MLPDWSVWATKSAANLIAGLEKSKERPLWRFVFGLGIRFVGEGAAKLLANHFRSIDAIHAASEEDIAAIDGIGEKTATSVREFFDDENNRIILEKLRAAGLPFEMAGDAAAQSSDERFAGKSFVFTGTLTQMKRNDAIAAVEERGGKKSSSVSKKTDYVVAGEDPGSKFTKAQQLGVTILTEAEFVEMLSQG